MGNLKNFALVRRLGAAGKGTGMNIPDIKTPDHDGQVTWVAWRGKETG
jgi:hypothetical protein